MNERTRGGKNNRETESRCMERKRKAGKEL